ncbi:antitoxin Xre/MbcA/ParS toxin-binding domain-containing protein [Planosporangium sp. 12N6]|uniref:antitoxin Xre/MbcA/ParS toxin-binding domain-containing protein n=1 Tax=Planosporangium spinosum TaxID=3402278 RepID=UPI003CEAEF16
MTHEAADGPVAVADVGSTGDVGPAEPVVFEECALAYGSDLLSYLLGAGSGQPLAAWRLETAAQAAWDRLRVCHRVLQAFGEPRLAKAWLRRAHPRLAGRTPAWAIRTGDVALLAVVEREAARLS